MLRKIDLDKIKRNIVTLIIPFSMLFILYLLIMAQNIEYNKYSILLIGILSFFMAFFVSYLLYSIFRNIRLEKGMVKQNIIQFILLVLIYYLITLYLSVMVFGTLHGFLPENVWKTFPEYEIYLIPTLSLSMLLLYRILGMFEKDIELLPKLTLSPKEMSDIIRDIFMGILVISTAIVFSIEVGVYTITKNISEFNLFALTSSLIVASIELSFWSFKNYLLNDIQLEVTEFQPHPVKEKRKFQIKLENIFCEHRNLFNVAIIFVLLVLFAIFTSVTPQTCYNATVLDVNVTEISTNNTILSINETDALVPLVIVNSKEKPLSERIEYMIENNVVSYQFLNKSLEVSTNSETYPLMMQRSWFGPDSPSLNCYPSDYDAVIFYALYTNGYSSFKLTNNFQDRGTVVFADKYFFNLNHKSNVAIIMHVTGTTLSPVDYEITIVTMNETVGNSIKEILEDDRRKANIMVIHDDPVRYSPFNCSLTENTKIT